MLQGTFKDVLSKFQGRIREVTLYVFFKLKGARKFQGCFEEVSRMFQKVLRVFQ